MSAAEEGELDYTLSTYEGWRKRAYQSHREKPPALTIAEINALTPQERVRYNNARHVWHANLGPFITPQMSDVCADLDMIVQSNRQDGDKVRSSPVLDAPPGMGKTTLVAHYAAGFHREQIELYGATTKAGHDRVPVAMVSLAGRTTMRGFNSMLCGFYAHPAANRGSAVELGRRASLCARETETRLIIVDDVHFLNPHTTDGREVANFFKWMATEFQATIIFVGVGLEKRGLFTEGLSATDAYLAQTARRWTRLPLPSLEVSDEASRANLRNLLLGVEDSLVLAKKYRGMLADDLLDYVDARCTGSIGSLFTLIMRGCHKAITTGSECLSRSLLDTVKNDSAAEQARLKLEAAVAHGHAGADSLRK